jgi:hypothetical protein
VTLHVSLVVAAGATAVASVAAVAAVVTAR